MVTNNDSMPCVDHGPCPSSGMVPGYLVIILRRGYSCGKRCLDEGILLLSPALDAAAAAAAVGHTGRYGH